jgi:O-antigen ligase
MLALFIVQYATHGGRRKAVALLGAGATGILLLATFTRIAWVGALVVVLVIGFCRLRFLLILVPIVAILAVIASPSLGARLADPLGGSFADRFSNLWPATIREWVEVTGAEPTIVLVAVSRLTGLGPGMGLILAERGGYFRISPAHNDYLRVLVDYGVFGVLMFILLLFVLMVFAFRTWRDARNSDPLLAGVALTFLALSLAFPLMSVTDNVFGYTANQVYFWTLAGLTVGVHYHTKRGAASGTGPTGRYGEPAWAAARDKTRIG